MTWMLQVVAPPLSVASPWEALGLTVSTLMLFIAGVIGAWLRVISSGTQQVRSQRTVVDIVIGGVGAVLFPQLAPRVIDPLLGIKLASWDATQQAALALLLGFTGSYIWTSYAWRKGLLVTPEQAATGEKPLPPEVGVLKNTKDAAVAVEKFIATQAKPPEAP